MKLKNIRSLDVIPDSIAEVMAIVKAVKFKGEYYLSDNIGSPKTKNVYFLVEFWDRIFAVNGEQFYKVRTGRFYDKTPNMPFVVSHTYGSVYWTYIIEEDASSGIQPYEIKAIRKAIKQYIAKEIKCHT